MAQLTLVGTHALWTKWGESPAVLYRSQDGLPQAIWQGREVPVPSYEQRAGVTVVQQVSALGASDSLVAFVYSAVLYRRGGPGGLPQLIVDPLFSEVWAGPPGGPFKRVAGAAKNCPGQGFATGVAVSGKRLAFSQVFIRCNHRDHPHRSNVVLVSLQGGSRATEVAKAEYRVFERVVLAGQYIGWEGVDNGDEVSGPPAIVVRRLGSTKALYRVGSSGGTAFDLRSDGTIALLAFQPGARCPAGGLGAAWASPKNRRLHFVSKQAWGEQIRISAGRLLFIRANPACHDADQRLVLSDLNGHARVLARDHGSLRLEGNFDLNGGLVAYDMLDAEGLGALQTIYIKPL